MRATSGGPEVSTVLVEPDDAIALMVLGHGSGTPIHRPVMVQMAEALAHQKIATFRYNYPYSEAMNAELGYVFPMRWGNLLGDTVGLSSDMIDPLDTLLSTTGSALNAANELPRNLPLFLGGRSMSSQDLCISPNPPKSASWSG